MKHYTILPFMLLLFFKAHTQTCTQPCHIVILGSSTAAGDGVSDITKSWAYMYAEYLKTINPNSIVDNLAEAGLTTYDAQPNDYVPPAGRPKPLHGHNITAALNLNPDAIIINFPTNDAANYFTLTEQENNFKRIINRAKARNVLVWVATPQPRNFFNEEQVERQKKLYDWIMSYYGDMAIDFHTGLASDVDSILYKYNSGDGIHLDYVAHQKLFRRVCKKNIPDTLCERQKLVPIAEEFMDKSKSVSLASF